MAYTRRQSQPTANKGTFLKPMTLIILIIVAGLVTVAVLEITNTTFLFHKQRAVSSTIPASVSTEPEADVDTSDTSGTGTTPPADQTVPPPAASEKTVIPPSSGKELLVPTGNFASNHRPSLKDSPGVESVCTTTPGAMCTITFTKDDVIKTLETKKTDQTGTVIWNWNVKEAGFIAGSWQITATATLDGQTKSASDLQPLEVQP